MTPQLVVRVWTIYMNLRIAYIVNYVPIIVKNAHRYRFVYLARKIPIDRICPYKSARALLDILNPGVGCASSAT